ncbi:MAG: DNA starvation/stationary phase protection protein [Treponema sp.]|nr:DNA starvation/stationary phase protection protein [Treponema sp.]
MIKELSTGLNAYVANLGVEYVKLHNLHWNVFGANFKAAHEYLEELYDEITEYFDEVAEFLRMQGELPVASLKDFLAIATIKELESKEVSIGDALKIASADLETLRNQALEIMKLADSNGEVILASTLEDHVKDYNKKLWFIKSMLK